MAAVNAAERLVEASKTLLPILTGGVIVTVSTTTQTESTLISFELILTVVR